MKPLSQPVFFCFLFLPTMHFIASENVKTIVVGGWLSIVNI